MKIGKWKRCHWALQAQRRATINNDFFSFSFRSPPLLPEGVLKFCETSEELGDMFEGDLPDTCARSGKVSMSVNEFGAQGSKVPDISSFLNL